MNAPAKAAVTTNAPATDRAAVEPSEGDRR